MNNTILRENENKRLNLRLPLLFCFALFSAWQVGMMYFSTQTLSVDGRMSLPVSQDVTTIIVAAGYILSILVMVFLPRIIVWTERVTVGVALLSALALFLPLSPDLFTLALYVQFFCCCFMIGFETAVIVNLFSENSAILHLTVAYAAAFGIPALLQNDFVTVPFGIFRLFAVLACALQLYFYCKLPGRVWPHYVKKSDNLICPKRFFAGIYAMEGLTALMTFFGLAISETVQHGVFAYQLSAAACGLAVFSLWKYKNVAPMRCASVLIGITALGFVFAIASLYIPSLSLLACTMLGAGITALGIQPLYGVIMAKRYPSRFIAPGFIGLCFAAILIHTVLLDILRDNLTLMYTVYLVVAVALVVLFFMLMPYLLYAFRGKPLVSEERAAELNNAAKAAKTEGRTLPEDIPAVKTVPDAVIVLEETGGHPADELTERERQVAQELMSGLDYKEIAAKLHISPYTVNAHKRSIYNKKDVHNVQGLIMKIGKLTAEQDKEERT